MAYDGECPRCRRWVDRVQQRDRWGLIVTFPLQNAELLRMAPELAGRPLHLQIHGVDSANRQVFAGADLLPEVLRRLPRWRMAAPLMMLPGITPLARWIYLRTAARRYRGAGGASLRR